MTRDQLIIGRSYQMPSGAVWRLVGRKEETMGPPALLIERMIEGNPGRKSWESEEWLLNLSGAELLP